MLKEPDIQSELFEKTKLHATVYGYQENDPSNVSDFRVLSDYELIYNVGGTTIVQMRDERYEVRQREMILIPSLTYHKIDTPKDDIHKNYWVHFTVEPSLLSKHMIDTLITNWGGLYSKTPAYITQCDFCYMISNDMFREFVLPSIEDHMEFLDHNIYHLDGIGELKHLEDLLALEKLDAIQWVFGAGQPSAKHWIDSVYKKIEVAKKGIFVIENMHDFDDVYEEIKDNLYYNPYIETENLYQVEKYLANF